MYRIRELRPNLLTTCKGILYINVFLELQVQWALGPYINVYLERQEQWALGPYINVYLELQEQWALGPYINFYLERQEQWALGCQNQVCKQRWLVYKNMKFSMNIILTLRYNA